MAPTYSVAITVDVTRPGPDTPEILMLSQKDEVVDGVLIESGELAEAGVHRARLRIQPGVVFARGLAEGLRVRGKLVPEAVEVDAFA